MRRPGILPSDTIVDRRADGVLYARSPHRLGPYPAKITERLRDEIFRRVQLGMEKSVLTVFVASERVRPQRLDQIYRCLVAESPVV